MQRKNFSKRNEKAGAKKGMQSRLHRLKDIGFQFHIKDPIPEKEKHKKKIKEEDEDTLATRKVKSKVGDIESANSEEAQESLVDIHRKRGQLKKGGCERSKEEALKEGESPKRKRGRPKKSIDSGITAVYPINDLSERNNEHDPNESAGKKRSEKDTGEKEDKIDHLGDKNKEKIAEAHSVRRILGGHRKEKLEGSKAKKRGRPRKEKNLEMADDNQPEGSASKKMVRPKKTKGDDETAEKLSEENSPSKKRGRPRKIKGDNETVKKLPEVHSSPKKKGRPKKLKSCDIMNVKVIDANISQLTNIQRMQEDVSLYKPQKEGSVKEELETKKLVQHDFMEESVLI